MKNTKNLDKQRAQEFQSLQPCQQYFSGLSNLSSLSPHISLKLNENSSNSNIHGIDIFGYDQFDSE